MNEGRTVFSQLIDFVPRHTFRRRVERYRGDYGVRRFTCWQQFLAMLFAQVTYRESLRDIEACLRSAGSKLYHMGFRSRVSRNTLANANQVRDWRIYADFAQVLIRTARELYVDDSFGIELKQTVYALDATIIDLCLSLFPWAKFRRRKGAVKLHTLLDLRGNRGETMEAALLALNFLLPQGRPVAYFATRRLFERRLNGYTGDCLGAVQQTSEVGLYIGLLACL